MRAHRPAPHGSAMKLLTRSDGVRMMGRPRRAPHEINIPFHGVILLAAELTPAEMWSLVLGEVQKRINPQSFRTWLEPTEAIALTADELLVNVKNQFALDYIAGQYGNLLNDVARGLFQDRVVITF